MKTIVIALFTLVVGGFMVYEVVQTFHQVQVSFTQKVSRTINPQ